MKRIGLLAREKITEEIKTRLQHYDSALFVSFNKTEAFPLNILRNEIRKRGSSFFVAKNSLLERAFLSLEKDIKDFLKQETAVIFVSDKNIVDVCKLLFDFSKENEGFRIKGGFLGNKQLNPVELENLSKLPSKSILLGDILGTFVSPLTSFLAVLRQPFLDFLLIIDDIKKRKEQSS